jgi:hypothetical protein
MRFRLLRRRLTVSAPRMSVRSALPWPFRWAVLAIVLGFCAAIGMWAFEFGKDIAGLDSNSKAELAQLRIEVASLTTDLAQAKAERDAAQSVANTADTLVTAEKASHEMLLAQSKQLEMENRSLRDDLGFFEKLIPAGTVDGLAIRGGYARNAKMANAGHAAGPQYARVQWSFGSNFCGVGEWAAVVNHIACWAIAHQDQAVWSYGR